MIEIRRADERGHADHGWLDTRHTFSFADYYDPRFMGFRSLRVINQDRVTGGEGFGTHPHRDMEIISYVLEGALEHKDSMGTGSVLRAGEFQRMSAGTGVLHSEFNASKSDPVHFLQIWIVPGQRGLTPSYEQKRFPDEERRGRLRLVASPDASDGALEVHQDVRLYSGLFDKGESVEHVLAPGRHAWVQIVSGAIALNGQELRAGDGAAVAGEDSLRLEARKASELLLFDLA